ncbi:hypothetical protein HMPREF0973_02371 [Prevotella veroralis F0319]|uniref:Uncharacterized protein n=1 Tax=Prevotella veroralis F0319 TaxID=649761 RepID=C9MRV8_9BACT|nr:hypothetical protein HMPREF0973_02371 [Prevotella veroralis F0319]
MELIPRVFFKMMLFLKLYAFGGYTGISFIDSEHLYGLTTLCFSPFLCWL